MKKQKLASETAGQTDTKIEATRLRIEAGSLVNLDFPNDLRAGFYRLKSQLGGCSSEGSAKLTATSVPMGFMATR